MNKRREKTQKQNRTLNWLLKEALLYDDDIRDYLETVCGKRYRRDMDFYDFQKAINDLSEKTGRLLYGGSQKQPTTGAVKPSKKTPGKKSDPITGEQLGFITELFTQMGGTPRQRRDWIQRQLKMNFPQTIGDGQSLIEALKEMKENGYHFDKKKEETVREKT